MKIKAFLLNHKLPVISFILMILSFLVTLPTGEMIVSLEWNGFAMALVMTLAIAGLEKEGIMKSLRKSAAVFSHIGSMAIFFAIITFILSPFITSLFAVASILPLAISLLEERERKEEIPAFAAIITVSGIAGGMILPGGSWHNMLLHMSLGEASFLNTMLPFFLASIPVIALSIPLLLGKKLSERTYINEIADENKGNKGMRMLYVCFAFVALLASLSLFKWIDIVIFTIAILLVFDRSVFLKADYSLLLSMVFLSIAGSCFGSVIAPPLASGGEFWKSIIFTEILGGLPVAAFGSGAGISGDVLLKAVNIGSNGTILSLPALMAYKIIKKENKKEFALKYTLISVLMLIVLIAVSFI